MVTAQGIDVYPFVISTGGRDLTRYRCSLSTRFLPPVEMTVPPEQLHEMNNIWYIYDENRKSFKLRFNDL